MRVRGVHESGRGLTTVFNLEVFARHEFFVGEQRVRAHNTYPGAKTAQASIREQMRRAGTHGLPGGRHHYPAAGGGFMRAGPFRFVHDKRGGIRRVSSGTPAYRDRFGNIWQEGPYHGSPAFDYAREWDVQLSPQGRRWASDLLGIEESKVPAYINVRPDGPNS